MGQSLSELIRADGIVKRYGRKAALDGLDIVVSQGQIHGFLGPNGSGKSTTIRAILGQLRLDGGRLTAFGLDPWRDAVEIHRRIAYVPGDVALWPSLSGGECIDLLGGLRGGLNRQRVDALIERFALDPSKRVRAYSKGNRQKVGLVAALAVETDLYILDEPTSGLDPLMEVEFQQVLAELRDDGRTILLSSHILSEVDRLCDVVTIIRAGRTVQSGPLDELRLAHQTVITAVTSRPPAGIPSEKGDRGFQINLTVEQSALGPTLEALAAADPVSVEIRPTSLDELFLEHYAEDASETQPAVVR